MNYLSRNSASYVLEHTLNNLDKVLPEERLEGPDFYYSQVHTGHYTRLKSLAEYTKPVEEGGALSWKCEEDIQDSPVVGRKKVVVRVLTEREEYTGGTAYLVGSTLAIVEPAWKLSYTVDCYYIARTPRPSSVEKGLHLELGRPTAHRVDAQELE